ncbi:MAG: hypothetical protein ACJA16_003776 [Akkermansiaceae bacterium]|jgi:hypothetical protein
MKTKTQKNLKSSSQKASSSALALRPWMLVPAVSVIMPFSGHAAVIAWDNFLTDGPLNGSVSAQAVAGGSGSTAWAQYSGTTPNQIQVTTGVATITDSNSEDVSLTFEGDVEISTDIYVGMTINVADPGSYTGNDFEYFAGFKPDSNFTLKARTDIADFALEGFKPGISSGSSVAEVTWASFLPYDTDYRMIVRYNATVGESQLWMSPIDESSTSIITTTTSTSAAISQFFFRQGSASPDFSLNVGGLVVGTDFNSVRNPVIPAPVPEPSSAILLALSSCGLAFRRKRS